MEEVNRLEGRINFIEREELTKIKDDINDIKCGQVEVVTLVKQFTEITKSNAEAMDSMKMAMYEISSSVKDSTKNLENLNTRFDTLETNVDNKITKVNERISCQEDKGKFDWQDYVKNKIIPMLVGGGIIGAIVSILGKVGMFK